MTTPQKLAVALQYEAPDAPRVTAIGRGAVAEKIVETARANDVPVRDNPALAQALAQLPLEQQIPESLYRAVAEVISYVLHVSRTVR
jgi:flagellar biosynthesis protein